MHRCLWVSYQIRASSHADVVSHSIVPGLLGYWLMLHLNGNDRVTGAVFGRVYHSGRTVHEYSAPAGRKSLAGRSHGVWERLLAFWAGCFPPAGLC